MDRVCHPLATHLITGKGQLLRWMGPAMVALLKRQDSQVSAAAEIQRVVSMPLSQFFETSSRSVP
jgi:hypothetical protein